jgi:hypothetical protein
LDVVSHDLGDATFFTFLILVGAVLQPAFDIEGIAFLHIFGRRLDQAIPADDRMDLGLPLALDGAVRSQADAGVRMTLLTLRMV